MQVRSTSSPRRTDEERREILARLKQSGLTQRAFCEREGLCLETLRAWKRKFRTRGESSDFVVVEPPEAPGATDWVLEVVLPSGVALRFRG